ncbi:hypothetical protein [Polaribacter sp. Hel1_85]|uniref:hypothetical protein n=1 Tax=Polaribacter sp. Hel1_85 TaxID=1250005 RepID=UPI00052BD1C4|nr:hypothetical protein [Polaribacter sp. Hel1_85]KGL62381.1 hypothetical protein PHEL85_2175 [Polaribacter sp. Hel1_85]
MSDIDWSALAEKAVSQTDAEFKNQLAGLTSLKTSEIDTFITESEITNNDALAVLTEINNASLSNNEKASAISNIQNGVGFLVKLVSKVV